MWAMVVGALAMLIAAFVVSYPLVFRNLEAYDRPEILPDQPYSQADALLDALGDLDLSFRSGKLSEADYQVERAQLQRAYIALVDTGRSAAPEASRA